MSLLLRFQVSGHSMEPVLKEGQEILVSSIPYFFKSPRVGDIVAFKDNGKFIVKRIEKIIGEKLQLTGDNKNDSKDFGWIERGRIIGKLIYP